MCAFVGLIVTTEVSFFILNLILLG